MSASDPSRAFARPEPSRWVRGLVVFIVLYTIWFWGGLRPGFHLLAVAASASLLVLLCAGGNRRGLLRDPAFWTGLVFVGYLAVQSLNAGRELYFDVGHRRWTYSLPRWRALPWSFDRAESVQMMMWFVPAWAVALAVRSSFLDTRSVHRLLRVLVYSSGVLALVGCVQFVTGAVLPFAPARPGEAFFASFTYANHAAAFFVLSAALAAGLLFRELFESGYRPRRQRVVALAGSMLACLAGANLSLSRAGILLGWTLGLLIGLYGLVCGWRAHRPAGRLKLLLAATGALGVLFFAVAGFGEQAIRREFAAKAGAAGARSLSRTINLDVGDRPLLAGAAVRIWNDHRWYGVGGWGYRHLVGHYVPAERWNELAFQGKANVHCDPLQSLVEFGLVGAGLLGAFLASLLASALRRRCEPGAPFVFGLTGLGMVLCFSALDLPFRCPAILIVWTALFAALPRLACPLHEKLGIRKP